MIRGLFLVAVSAAALASAKPTRPTPPPPEGGSSGSVSISINPQDMPLRTNWWSGLCASGSAAEASGAMYQWSVDPTYAEKVELVDANSADARIRAKTNFAGSVPVRLVVSNVAGEASIVLKAHSDGPPDYPPKPTDPTTTAPATTTSSTTKSTPAEKPSGNAQPWKSGEKYNGGDLVIGSDSKTYKCKEFPASGWCGLADVYKPSSGGAWANAWDLVG